MTAKQTVQEKQFQQGGMHIQKQVPKVSCNLQICQCAMELCNNSFLASNDLLHRTLSLQELSN